MKRDPTDEAIAALSALTPAQRLRTWADEIVAYNERLGVRAPAYVDDVLEVLDELERLEALDLRPFADGSPTARRGRITTPGQGLSSPAQPRTAALSYTSRRCAAINQSTG